jgi:(2R)-3-sulfolactate dehydrogenase (NADP+)
MARRISSEALQGLATRVLEAAGTAPDNARAVAVALVAADADGLPSHGVSRLPFYADQVASGKVDGRATPEVRVTARAAVRVDARCGFAYPAIRAGLDRGLELLGGTGVVGISIANSHHSGAGGLHVEYAAQRGCLALGFSNTPSGMAPWGGSRGTFGTNPVAFACPRTGHPPIVVDLSLSRVARGKVMMARGRGERIPEGWAIDAEGRPTTDADAALAGTMVPIGEAKGSGLALMVEILCAGLSASHFAYEASSFFDAEGPPPRIGQWFLLIAPGPFAGDAFFGRIEDLVGEMQSQDGVRLPGDRRWRHREEARRVGIVLPDSLLEDLERRAAGG